MANDLDKGLSLLKEAGKREIVLFLEDGQLKYKTNGKTAVDQDFIGEIRRYKKEIQSLLAGRSDNHIPDWDSVIAHRVSGGRSPLSFSQERLWFIHRLEGSAHYHIPWVWRLTGILNIQALEAACQEVVDRHEVLRTVLKEEEGIRWQEVMDKGRWQMETIDGSKLVEQTEQQQLITALVDKPFDLSKDHPLRVHLIALSGNEHLLILTLHHIAADAWSWNILMQELTAAYAAHEKGRTVSLPPLPIQYADYALWQRRFLQGERQERQLAYWRKQLAGAPPLVLPSDFPRPGVQTTIGTGLGMALDAGLSLQLKAFSISCRATLFVTVLTALKVLLYRYSGQKDICIGTPMTGRIKETERLIGFFLNTIVIRSRQERDMSFQELLDSVKQTVLEAYDHQDIPFGRVVEEVVTERQLHHSPLFQVMFVMQHAAGSPDLHLGETVLSNEPFRSWHAKFDLTVTVADTKEGLYLHINYRKDLYKESAIHRMLCHYQELLRSIVAAPALQIGTLRILPRAEENILREEFGRARVDYPKDKSIVDLFTEQAVSSPGAKAVITEEQSLSYEQLHEMSSRLAAYLRRKGVNKESLVGICVERSAAMIVGIFAIMKAGGAFVPIHPDHPADHIRFVLDDTRCAVCLVNPVLKEKILSFTTDVDLVDSRAYQEMPHDAVYAPDITPVDVSPAGLAYIIYTSGSTGRPKGVMIEHGALVEHVSAIRDGVGLTNCRSFALIASLVADGGYSMLFCALLQGSATHILSDSMVLDGNEITAYFRSNDIDCLKIIPSLWMSYAGEGRVVMPRKVIIFGGEPMPSTVLPMLRDAGYKGDIFNHYGPTETTIGKLLYKTDPERTYDRVPIGRPFSNSNIYITDGNGQLCPIGVPGEIRIGGAGLARGYWARPELTEQKFIPDPFGSAGSRVYLTGDIGRWLEDGNIELQGRVDDQVKIRGHRIELGEIEIVAEQSGLVRQVAVVAPADSSGHRYLAGYVVADDDFRPQALTDYLADHLPGHMIPSVWIPLPVMPLTRIGKIDKQALPAADGFSRQDDTIIAPRNNLEMELAGIWQALLRLEQVGITQSFFSLGGHSLLIFPMVDRIRKLGYPVVFKDIFKYQTIQQLAAGLLASMNARADAPSHLRLLHKGKQGKPLFILPGSPGFCDAYDELATAVGGSHAIYGVQMMGLKEGEEPPMSLTDTAQIVKGWLREIQPHGPYRLIAHSFGAYLAVEVNRLWQLEGESAEFIVMLDAPVHKRTITTDEQLLQTTGIFLEHYWKCPPAHRNWIDQLRSVMGGWTETDKIRGIVNHIRLRSGRPEIASTLHAALVQSAMAYRLPEDIGTKLVIVSATETTNLREAYLGWQRYTQDCKLITGMGDHWSMVQGENASRLAEKIKDCLAL
ncbi:amino acid adenylation domain-containing protein [Flavitalea sp. BT771]|uniref:non-ribosomal peptide synthetase n=1 Tax=Flavitalea sp. BT771 TaxID=3063329 RepID=UPI0026E22F1E|nr:amino acid adenylation domain-containing protein [Flavitalea sp. BT771]MDO6431642.1 amino acid adenylation domain-containing protein [Flavitalea sp. BT771]MDV6220550.1 amino acid adenylation domain-containing protein [Flavitalea sp. BT771]